MGANDAKAINTEGSLESMHNNRMDKVEYVPALIPAKFLNGDKRSMKTTLMLNICTPPPDMYNMNACIGNDLAGEMARSQARFSFKASYD